MLKKRTQMKQKIRRTNEERTCANRKVCWISAGSHCLVVDGLDEVCPERFAVSRCSQNMENELIA